MSTLHVTTVADKGYCGIIPLYLHCLLTAYPRYHATVFTRDLPGDIEDVLKKHPHRDRFKIVKHEFDDYPIGPKETASLRFLLFTPERVEQFFRDDDYVYITDVDMMFVRERPGILRQHIEHMKVLGLPYSNKLRACYPTTLTGAHFVSAEYIEDIQYMTGCYDDDFYEDGLDVLDTQDCIVDERLLYQIVRDSVIRLPPHPDEIRPRDAESVLFRPWHGINIGYGRQPIEKVKSRELHAPQYAKFKAIADDGYLKLLPDWAKKALERMEIKWA